MAQQTFTVTTTWTCPPGVYFVTAECWAGGGAGAGQFANNTEGSGGGGEGAYSKKKVAVVPGTTYTVTVGIGGATNGAAGGDSWFISNVTVLAKGGGGGTNSATTGQGQGGQASGGIGDTKISGNDGQSVTAAGGAFFGSQGGFGAVPGAGVGGSGTNAGLAQATDGTVLSAGGGGQSFFYGTGNVAGHGARGQVVLTWPDGGGFMAKMI